MRHAWHDVSAPYPVLARVLQCVSFDRPALLLQPYARNPKSKRGRYLEAEIKDKSAELLQGVTVRGGSLGSRLRVVEDAVSACGERRGRERTFNQKEGGGRTALATTRNCVKE